MGIGNDKAGAEVQLGRRRVAEMERHVQFLRDELIDLERGLLDGDKVKWDRLVEGEIQDIGSNGSIGELERKGKSLRKQIYELQCVKTAYTCGIADQKRCKSNDKMKSCCVAKCDSCVACCCNKRNLACIKENHKKSCEENNKSTEKCTCIETSRSSSDSEESCGYAFHQNPCLINTSCCACERSKEEADDMLVGSSNDAATKCRCCKDDELLDNACSDKVRSVFYTDRQDVSNSAVALHSTDDNSKLVKVNELCQDLRRLRVRNENLKVLLETLENPLKLAGDNSRRSVCSRVSSYYTIDLPRQSDAELLAIARILKGRCRDKDAIVVALSDEFAPTDADELKLWKRTRFTRNDSIIGFLVFFAVVASHLKPSDLRSRATAAKKLLVESARDAMSYVGESDSLRSACKRAAQFSRRISDASLDGLARLAAVSSEFATSCLAASNALVGFCADNRFYFLYAFSAILTVALLVKHRRTLCNEAKIVDKVERDKYNSTFTTISEKLLSSRLFWLAVGVCSHAILNELRSNLLNDEAESIAQKSIVNTDCELTHRYDISWIASLFMDGYRSIAEYVSGLFQKSQCESDEKCSLYI